MTGIKVPERTSFAHVLMVVLLTGLMFGCKSTTSNPIAPSLVGGVPHDFPQFFLEKGSDVDSSYISFRGRYSGNDTLQLEMTSWGVVEYGLFIQRQNSRVSALFSLMGRCGTVLTKTWKKVTLTERLTPSEQDTLWNLSFTNWKDTLAIVKTSVTGISR